MAKKQETKRRKFQIPINRFCRFTKAGFTEIDYKDVDLLSKYINDRGKIKSRKSTGTKAPYQRELAIAIKRSRHMAFMPFVKITQK